MLLFYTSTGYSFGSAVNLELYLIYQLFHIFMYDLYKSKINSLTYKINLCIVN